jgi:uncharacterized protein
LIHALVSLQRLLRPPWPVFAAVLACALWAGFVPADAAGEATIEIISKSGVHPFSVELATNDAEREHGLMDRKELPEGRGMLFDFEHEAPVAFWMHNTYIPLDMIFIAADKKVVGIEENAEPLTLQPRGPDEDSQFVLEVPGGWARTHGVERGVSVRFVDID